MMIGSRRASIAVVDSDVAVCRSIQALVRARRIDTTIFSSARDFITAVESIPAFTPDCIILNMQLSELNGFDALDRLRRTRADVPVICLTGGGEGRVPRVAVASGAAASFEKPLDPDRFLETLLDILDARSTGERGNSVSQCNADTI